jgi:hypothetical protein
MDKLTRFFPLFTVLIFTLLSTGCDKGSVADLLNHKSSEDLTPMNPKDQVQNFYTWYLEHFVTPSFLNQAKKISGVNPILFNQDLPKGFQISPGPNKDTVIVQLIFEPGILERELLVTLVQETGRWVIDNISLVQ